ncbi:hypothetical protein V6Z11_D05G137500 [Gossypium hirsutum]
MDLVLPLVFPTLLISSHSFFKESQLPFKKKNVKTYKYTYTVSSSNINLITSLMLMKIERQLRTFRKTPRTQTSSRALNFGSRRFTLHVAFYTYFFNSFSLGCYLKLVYRF